MLDRDTILAAFRGSLPCIIRGGTLFMAGVLAAIWFDYTAQIPRLAMLFPMISLVAGLAWWIPRARAASRIVPAGWCAETKYATLAAAINQASEGVMITDSKGRIQYVNPVFTRMTGYTPEEVVGNNPRILKSGMQDQVYYKALWETILAGRIWHGCLTNRRKDGTFYEEEMTIAPVRDASATPHAKNCRRQGYLLAISTFTPKPGAGFSRRGPPRNRSS